MGGLGWAKPGLLAWAGGWGWGLGAGGWGLGVGGWGLGAGGLGLGGVVGEGLGGLEFRIIWAWLDREGSSFGGCDGLRRSIVSPALSERRVSTLVARAWFKTRNINLLKPRFHTWGWLSGALSIVFCFNIWSDV